MERLKKVGIIPHSHTRFPIENEYSRPDDLKKNLMKIGVQFLSVPTVTTRPCMCGRKEKEKFSLFKASLKIMRAYLI